MSSPGLLNGETGHEPSVSWGDPVAQTGWEGCSFLAAQPCLSALHILAPACLGDHPVPLLSWDIASVHTGSGRRAALSWSLPWHTSAQPRAAAQRAAKLAGSSLCFHPMLGSHLPVQTAWVSTAPMPPTQHQQASPVLPGSLSLNWHGLYRRWRILSPCWDGGHGRVWASAWKTFCWPNPHPGWVSLKGLQSTWAAAQAKTSLQAIPAAGSSSEASGMPRTVTSELGLQHRAGVHSAITEGSL